MVLNGLVTNLNKLESTGLFESKFYWFVARERLRIANEIKVSSQDQILPTHQEARVESSSRQGKKHRVILSQLGPGVLEDRVTNIVGEFGPTLVVNKLAEDENIAKGDPPSSAMGLDKKQLWQELKSQETRF